MLWIACKVKLQDISYCQDVISRGGLMIPVLALERISGQWKCTWLPICSSPIQGQLLLKRSGWSCCYFCCGLEILKLLLTRTRTESTSTPALLLVLSTETHSVSFQLNQRRMRSPFCLLRFLPSSVGRCSSPRSPLACSVGTRAWILWSCFVEL